MKKLLVVLALGPALAFLPGCVVDDDAGTPAPVVRESERRETHVIERQSREPEPRVEQREVHHYHDVDDDDSDRVNVNVYDNR